MSWTLFLSLFYCAILGNHYEPVTQLCSSVKMGVMSYEDQMKQYMLSFESMEILVKCDLYD